jgi:hypothetical protein
MVEEVQAWRAADGSLHSARLDAAKQDAMLALGKLDIFNHASAQAIVRVAADIVPILQQVIDATPTEPSDA